MLHPQLKLAAAGAKILIVEDEGIIANTIASRLAKSGYEVAGIADSSEEALAKIPELNPELVLMDIRIKGAMDGIETAVQIRERFDIPFIFLSAHTDRQTVDRARTTGASGFLTKPIHHENLAATIEMAIHKHRANRAGRDQRAWMATVLGTMADAMVVIDRDRKIQFLNGPAEELTGWKNEDAKDLDVALVLPLAESASGFHLQVERTALRAIRSPDPLANAARSDGGQALRRVVPDRRRDCAECRRRKGRGGRDYVSRCNRPASAGERDTARTQNAGGGASGRGNCPRFQ